MADSPPRPLLANRTVFFLLFHMGVAFVATGTAFLLARLAGWQGSPFIPVFLVALFGVGPTNRWAAAAYARRCG